MSERVRRWDECSGDPCICPQRLVPPVHPLPDAPLRAEVARIAATCEAIAAMPTENERAARCLLGVATSLRSALEKH